MNLALLDTFSAVMKTGSTAKAAALLRVSQPAVSRALKRLEDTTRLTLFERNGPRLKPTPEAELFHAEILDAHVGLDRLKQAVARIRDVGSGSLRIASSPALGLTFLPKVIQKFAARRPGVSVTFEIGNSADVRNRVASGAFDLGLCADEIDRSNLVVEEFVKSRGICVMPHDHPLARLRVIRPQNLDGVDFISLAPEDTARRRLERLLGTAGVRPVRLVETPFSATVCQLALEGVGVGLANPHSFIAGAYAERGLVARPFEPAILFRALLVFPPQRPRSRVTNDFVDVLARCRTEMLT